MTTHYPGETRTGGPAPFLVDVDTPVGPPVLRADDFCAAAPVTGTEPARSRPAAIPLERRHRVLLRLADAVALSVAATLGAVLVQLVEPARAGDIELRQVVIVVLSLGAAFHLHGLYRRPASRLRPSGWWRPLVIGRCLPTATLLALAVEALLFSGGRMTLSAAVAMTVPAALLAPFGRRQVVRWFGPPTVTRILIVGTGQVADRLAARLGRCSDTHVVGSVDDAPAPGSRVLGGLAGLAELCRRHRVDRVIVAFSRVSDADTLHRLRTLEGQVPVSVIPRLFELHSWRSEVEELHGLPLLHVPSASLGAGARMAKRTLDVVLAASFLLVTLPIGLVIAAVIRLDSSGPIFFRQDRRGRAGQEFSIFKFRTMTADAWDRRAAVAQDNEVDGPLFKMQHDPRVTTVGRFLRRTSIDEFPQLINVLRGEMSLVGPRPLPTEESDRLDGAALTRFDVAPGLTGLWQVSGRSDLTYADLQHLDSVYVRSWSLMWDVRIICATPRSVFCRSGAY